MVSEITATSLLSAPRFSSRKPPRCTLPISSSPSITRCKFTASARTSQTSPRTCRRSRYLETAGTNKTPPDNCRAWPQANRLFDFCLRLPPKLAADQIHNRGERQHDSSHDEFANRRMGENPKDRQDRQRGHNFHSREIEGLTIRAHIALHQKPAAGAAKQIHQQHRDVRKHRQLFKGAAD